MNRFLSAIALCCGGVLLICLITGCPRGTSTGAGETDRCCFPITVSTEDARKAYTYWKNLLTTSEGANGFRRVVRPDTPDGIPYSTVSEGIAYGMILAVYHDDQPLFDDLFRYSLHWDDGTGLMAWYIDPTGTVACPGFEYPPAAATDSDEDIAFALIMADKKWGTSGALDRSYRDYALRQIELVKKLEVDAATGIVKPGNSWGGPDLLNLSYFAPAFYEIFGRYSDDAAFWNHVVDVNYEALFNSLNDQNGNAENGLVPAWSNFKGEPVEAFDGASTHFQTDSIRALFRIAQHYHWTGDARAKAYLDKVNSFFVPLGAGNLTDEYELDGTPKPMCAPEASSRSAVVVGCTAVAAMSDPAGRDYTEEASDLLCTLELTARSTYYQLSWSALTLTYMSGIYVDLTRPVGQK